MARTTITGFENLGKVFNAHPAEGKPARKKCRKCGCNMTQIEGTNVWFCHGKTNEGKPCDNRVIASVGTTM